MNAMNRRFCRTCSLVLVLIIASTSLADDDADLNVAFKLGVKLENEQKFAESAKAYEKALPLAIRLRGPSHPEVANISQNLGFVRLEMGDYAIAEKHYLRAVAIREARFGKDHVTVANALFGLARLTKNLGHFEKAEPIYLRTIAIWEKQLGQDSIEMSYASNSLANLYSDWGRDDRAEPLYQRALSIAEVKLGADAPFTLQVLHNLANIAQDRSEYDKAESMYLRCLALREKKLGKDHVDCAQSLLSLGNVRKSLGDFAKAEQHYLRAITIHEARSGKDSEKTADVLNSLASLYENMGLHAKAESIYQRCLTIYETKLGKEHHRTAMVLGNMAQLYDKMGQLEKSESLLLRALANNEATLGKDHTTTAAVTLGLATLYLNRRQLEKAEPLMLKALARHEAAFGRVHASTANVLNNLANLYRDMGQYAKAEPLYRRALDIYRARLGKDHHSVAVATAGTGWSFAAQGRLREAVHSFDRALRGFRLRTVQVLPILGDDEQLKFLTEFQTWLRTCLAMSLSPQFPKEHTSYIASWLINNKAVSFEALAERSILARDADTPESRKVLAELKSIRRKLAQTVIGEGSKTDPKALEEFTDRERRLSASLAAFDGRTRSKDPWIELDEVRQRLPDDAVFIDISVVREFDYKSPQMGVAHYVAVITTRDAEPRLVDLGEQTAIGDLLKAVRRELEASEATIREKGEAGAEKVLKDALTALGEKILAPLEPYIKRKRRWIISPDADLWLVPWGILPAAGGKYAVESHTIQYVLSGRDLLVNALKQDRKSTAPIVFADPDFDVRLNSASLPSRLAGKHCPGAIGDWKVVFAFKEGGKVQIQEPDGSVAGNGAWNLAGDRLTILTSRARFTGTLSSGQASGQRVMLSGASAQDRWRFSLPDDGGSKSRSLSKDFKFGSVRRLPGTAIEAEAILPRIVELTGIRPTMLTDRQALANTFRAMKSPRVLVLSTHGFFMENESKDANGKGSVQENPLLRCGLLLAGCNHAAKAPPGGDTGVLTGLEIVGTDLRGTELVVLSACDTGLGDVRNGEGVAGLRQAFQLAGAESVVATVWQVPDRDSALLMSSFFDKLAAKQARDVALAEAQREMIKNRRDRFGAAHPYFWAAYTLTGQAK